MSCCRAHMGDARTHARSNRKRTYDERSRTITSSTGKRNARSTTTPSNEFYLSMRSSTLASVTCKVWT
jgi:hypothetical protein